MTKKFTQKTEDIKKHYELEKKLAAKLMNAPKDERKTLYTELYNQLYRSLPSHSRWDAKKNPGLKKLRKPKQKNLLKPRLKLKPKRKLRRLLLKLKPKRQWQKKKNRKRKQKNLQKTRKRPMNLLKTKKIRKSRSKRLIYY